MRVSSTALLRAALVSMFVLVSGASSLVVHAESYFSAQLGEQQERLDRLKKKAEKGDVSALHELGLVYLSAVPGYGYRLDVPEAMAWFRRASEEHFA